MPTEVDRLVNLLQMEEARERTFRAAMQPPFDARFRSRAAERWHDAIDAHRQALDLHRHQRSTVERKVSVYKSTVVPEELTEMAVDFTERGSLGKETPLFAPFIHKVHDFTKPGSGQT